MTVEAGRFARRDSPIRILVNDEAIGELAPIALRLTSDNDPATTAVVQADRSEGKVRLTWITPKPIPAGASAHYTIDTTRPIGNPGPWYLDRSPIAETLRHDDKVVFRYNAAPVTSPNYGPIQHRNAYIHPAYSPSGALVTGDFSKFHPHHRGIFFAYAKAKSGDRALDFWNIQTDKGKIVHERLDGESVGPVTARFSTRHRWVDKAGAVVLRERWDVEAFAIPGSPYWLFDLTSTQQAEGMPFEVLPYRYGGIAYRGAEPFVKGPIDVLTAEGRHRVDGNLKPTRWVDLTGPIADGSPTYAGAMIADHPSNPNHPTVARIHPTTLPFFSFVPASDKQLTIAVNSPTVFRYRIMIHDGRPDADRDERTWRDFSEPPKVMVDGR